MLRRAVVLGLTVAGLASCTDKVFLYGNQGADGGLSNAKDAPISGLPESTCSGTVYPFQYDPDRAQLIIVLDRSSSMQGGFPNSTSSRASVVQAALDTAIDNYHTSINLGFEPFPSDPSGMSCQSNATDVWPQPAANNAKFMKAAISCDQGCPGSDSQDSPWHFALMGVRDYFRQTKSSSWNPDRTILLVTAADEPTCASDTHTSDACSSAKTAANDLCTNYDSRLYLLSVGHNPDANSCLSRVSQISSILPPIPNLQTLYPATNANDLNNYLNQLFHAIAKKACTVTTHGLIPTGQGSLLVTFGTKTISQVDDPSVQNGWNYTGDFTGITLGDKACDDYLNSLKQTYEGQQGARLSISYCTAPCDGGGCLPHP
jgi:hypothetical protein